MRKVLVFFSLLFLLKLAVAKEAKIVSEKGILNVLDFGAKGDGKSDDTQAFQKALDEAGKKGGIVFVPAGNYLIKSHLIVPPNVTLEGTFKAPPTTSLGYGSTLLAVEGKGNAEGEPFIVLQRNSTLKGLVIYYPEQNNDNPLPYPWTIQGRGDNVALIDVLLVNSYQAVDFGTFPCGRHYIKGLYAHAFHKGLFIDKCFDIGRVEDVHFWPFATGRLDKFSRENGEAFIIGRTDWEYMMNCFAISFKVGFHFIRTKDGAPNVVLTQCGSDIGPTAVLVDDCQTHAGISFLNGQFMAGIEIKPTNTGPVKFTNCGFWGIETTDSHAIIEGKGQVTFNTCHFISWAHKDEKAPAIKALSGNITIIACDFMDEGRNQIYLGEKVETAIILANRFRGGERIINESKGNVQIGFNTKK
ncbi:MAG: glycosyl hydrolase family 28-related protein [bacterium]